MRTAIHIFLAGILVPAAAAFAQIPEMPAPVQSTPTSGAEKFVQQGMNFYVQQEYDNAVLSYNQALKLDPKNVEAFLGRGFARLAAGSKDEAFLDFGKVIEYEGDGLNAYSAFLVRGQILQGKGEFDSALAEVNKAVAIKPNDPNSYLSRGKLLHAKGDRDGAITDFEKAISLRPIAVFYALRGALLKEKGNFEAALADFGIALQKSPRETSLYVGRGDVYLAQGNLESAAADYNKALEMNGGYALAYAHRGVLKVAQGKDADAKGDLDKAVELDGSLKAWIEKALSEAKAKTTTAAAQPPAPQTKPVTTPQPQTGSNKKKAKPPKKP